MHAFITGTAGFIGFHLANKLLELGWQVTGLDAINDYYDTSLKYGRLQAAGIAKENIIYNKPVQSTRWESYRFVHLKMEDRAALEQIFAEAGSFDVVINLAAQAGVRYSLSNPYAYVDSNIVGFVNLLECCRHYKTGHLVYASSSSVYGLNETVPFRETDSVDHPISLYAATKKCNELMAHTYSHLYGLPTTGLRFFTVYGPWGRPDMALFLFTKAIFEGRRIDVYNYGQMERDFTYIDDIVDGVVKVANHPAKPATHWDGALPNPATSTAPYHIYNIGNSRPVKLLDFIDAIERKTGIVADKNMMPMQPGDVLRTYADVSSLTRELGYEPSMPFQEGVNRFVDWYRAYYNC
jgi:UDP-glucuronate 4-epimerase